MRSDLHRCRRQIVLFRHVAGALGLQWLRSMIAISLIAFVALAQTNAVEAPMPSDSPVQTTVIKKARVIPATPHLPPPDGYRAATRPNISLVATGGGVFLTTWAASSIVMLPVTTIGSIVGACDRSTDYLLGFLPVLGLPLLEGRCTGSVGPISLVSSGLQLAGIAIAVAGIIWPQHIWVLEKRKTPVQVSLTGQGLGLRF